MHVDLGFHDATNLRNYSMLGSGIQFAKHIKRYLHDLLPACQKIIWYGSLRLQILTSGAGAHCMCHPKRRLGINACKTETLEEAVW